MGGFVKVDGNVVSVAAKRAYNVQKIEDDKLREKCDGQTKRVRAMLDYWSSGKAKEDFDDVWNTLAKEEEYITYKHGWFGRKEVKNKRSVCSYDDDTEMLKLLLEKSEYWDHCSVLDCISSKRMYGDITFCAFYKNVSYLPPIYQDQANHFKKYFDLNGDVFLPIHEYNRLKEFMDDAISRNHSVSEEG